ncbi:MAG: hypothetical protein ACXWMT_08825 [Candidatus Binataceae bacterium]
MRRRVVLPRAVGPFKASSVAGRPGDWTELYDAVIRAVRRAGDLVVLPPARSPRPCHQWSFPQGSPIYVAGSGLVGRV